MLKFRPTKPVSSLQAKSFVKMCNSIDPNLIDRVEGWKWKSDKSGISEGKAKVAIKKLKRRKIEGADRLYSLYSIGPNNVPLWSAFDGVADIAPVCPISQLAYYINQIIDEAKKESTPGFVIEMYYDPLNAHLINIEKDLAEFGWTAKDVQLAILTSICKQQRKLVSMKEVIKRRNCLTDEEFNEEIGNDWLCNKIKEIDDDDLLDQALPYLPTFAADCFS